MLNKNLSQFQNSTSKKFWSVECQTKKLQEMLSLQHFATNPKQYVVINGKNNNFSGMFKLKAIKTYHLGFIVKALQ